MSSSHLYDRIVAYSPTGSGAIAVHRQLCQSIPGYELISYPPSIEWTPWRMRKLRARVPCTVHTSPDYGVWLVNKRDRFVATFHNYVLDRAMKAHSSVIQRIHYATDLRFYTRLALKRAARVTAVSRSTAELVREDLGFRGDIQVIPNSVDVDRFRPRPCDESQGKPRVLFCGNPTLRKGFHWLPAIARGIGEFAELACATGGRQTPLPTSDRLTILGSIKPAQMPDVYRSSSVFILPSVREGMSLALLEAMASGLPVVTWRIPSSCELLDRSGGGLLVEFGDVDGFIERIRWLLQNPAQAARMGQRNRDLAVADHRPETMASAYAALLTDSSG
jgi:glycosyltransferase involved in cell wall biosynthesis